jgi:flagellar motor switch protein FliN/FliY
VTPESVPSIPDPSEAEAAPDATPAAATEEGAPPAGASALEPLLDVAMPVIIEIGRTHMTLSEVLRLDVGSVVQLERLVGEPVDIHVSDRKLAEGEVVVIGDHFGVRVTRVLSKGESKEKP